MLYIKVILLSIDLNLCLAVTKRPQPWSFEQYLTHLAIKAAWFGPTPSECSHPTSAHPILMAKFLLCQRREKPLARGRKAGQKKKKNMQTRPKVTYSSFQDKSEIQGELQTRLVLPKMFWQLRRSAVPALDRKSEPSHGTNNILCLQPPQSRLQPQLPRTTTNTDSLFSQSFLSHFVFSELLGPSKQER